MVRRKICVVTGARSEYGLLRYLMEAVRNSPQLELQLIATGMHLSPEFGLTYRGIEADGFRIDRKVEMLLSSDTPVGIAKSTGLGLMGFADALAEIKPDLIVVLGDRYEIFAAVQAALFARIPVAHLHGGESTEGAFDEGVRHAITKLSQLHFVAAETYRDRVIQLGENPRNVHLVGGLGVDALLRTQLLSREEIEEQLKLKFGRRNILITFHPATLEFASTQEQFQTLLDALDKDLFCIFTKANADPNGRIINQLIDSYVESRSGQAVAFTSLGQIRYWSVMAIADAVVGNSSSGLLEAPSLRIPTVNIGDRQTGRLAARSVVNCHVTKQAIERALSKALSPEFRESIRDIENPYGSGGAVERIVGVLETVQLDEGLLKKRFFQTFTSQAVELAP